MLPGLRVFGQQDVVPGVIVQESAAKIHGPAKAARHNSLAGPTVDRHSISIVMVEAAKA
jgi:hypothetical protein